VKDYHINIFYSAEDGAYIADIPDLEACSAFGDTAEKLSQRFNSLRPRGLEQPGKQASQSLNHVTDR
jgi:hypothetical protein